MIKEAILDYFKKQQDIVITNFEAAKADHDADALHDLRVGIKRLKALYQVLDPMSKNKFDYKAHFEDIRVLFKAVGKLRDIQVLSKLFDFFAKETELETVKDFYQEFKSKESSESETLHAALREFNPALIQDSLNDASMFLDGIKDKKAAKLTVKQLKKRLKQIKKLLPEKKDEEKMHEMRSRVKQAYYIIELLYLMQPEREQLENPKAIKLAGELLGQWHDHVVLADAIADFLEGMADIEDFNAEPYTDLLSTIRKDGKNLLKEARKVLKNHSLKTL